MFTPEKETPRHQARGAAAVCEDNHGAQITAPASKLFAQADAIAVSIPVMMTRERKRETASRLLDLWLQALAASRGDETVV